MSAVRHTLGWLVASLLTALCSAQARAADAPAAANVTAATKAPSALLDERTARDAIEHAPTIIASRELVTQGQATQRKLAVGMHEWELSVTARKRSELAGRSYREQEFELARGVRLPGKRSLDRQIGEQTADNGEYAFEDAWHEAGRTLLAGWFECLRAERMSQVRAQLRDVQQNVLDSVGRRVRGGDAPELEERLARSELQRAEFELAQSRQAALLARTRLLKEYPTLALQLPTMIPQPQPLTESDVTWFERIVASNHEIKLADGLSAASGLAAQRARLERVADPTLGVIYSDNFDQNRNTIGLKISVPLGGRARSADAALAASRARAMAAEAQLARLRVEGDARQDLANRHAYFEQWQSLAEASTQTQQNAAAYARGYSSGEFDLLALLNAQQLAAQARLAAETAQLNALEADGRLRVDAHLLWTPDED